MKDIWYIGHDNSGHRYLVPWEKRHEFSEWAELPQDDPNGWIEPIYVDRIDGGAVTFENPIIRDWK